MPVAADASKPVRTVDATGQTIATNTGNAPAVKTVDSVGRAIQQDATKVAEQAAADAGVKDPGQPANDTTKADNDNGQKPEADKPPPNEQVRRVWLEAQKSRRRAAEMEKRAQENLKRAEAFAQAKALADSGEDPTAILAAAGLDPAKYYQELTKYALSDKAKKPEDPVAKELREHKERLDKYAKDLEIQTKTLEDERALQQHNKAITDHVIPLLQSNPDRYEALFAEYGPNTAVEVYRCVWEDYQRTGKIRDFGKHPDGTPVSAFEGFADEMEAFWTEQVDKGIQVAQRLKKFQNRFAQNDNGQGSSVDRAEVRRSVTLSNKPSLASPLTQPTPLRRKLTWDERAEEIVRKFEGR